MDAEHVFFAAVEDMPEAVGQFFEELLVKRVFGPDRQAFQLLQAAALRDQTALPGHFRPRGSDPRGGSAAIRARDRAG